VPLAPGTNYSVLVTPGGIRDAANLNSFAGITSATAFNFTTSGATDVLAPTLTSSSPADGSTNVSVGSDIVLHFSEPVQRGSGDIQIHNSDGSLLTSIPVTDTFQVKFAGATVTIDPKLDLPEGSNFYVTLPSGAIRDYAGNTFAGLSTPT